MKVHLRCTHGEELATHLPLRGKGFNMDYRPKHRRDGNVFIFDPVELARVGRALNLSTDIETKITCEGCEGR